MDCTTTFPELKETKCEIEAAKKMLNTIGVAPLVVSVNIDSIFLWRKMRHLLKLTDISCCKIGEEKCHQCASDLEADLSELLDIYRESRKRIADCWYLPITRWEQDRSIDSLEDRIDTLRFITDKDLHSGMTRFINELKTRPRTKNSRWRETLESL